MDPSYADMMVCIDGLWKNAIEIESEDDDHMYFYKLRLNRHYTQQLEASLKLKFQNYPNENVYETHMGLTQLCNDYQSNSKQTKALFLAQTFHGWLMGCMKKTKKAVRVAQSKSCSEKPLSGHCLCCISPSFVIQAFDISTRHHMNLFTVFNKIYRFSDNTSLIQPLAIGRLNILTKDLNYVDQANLLGELQLQNHVDIKQVTWT
jgi:hypothetical protein